jgi:hypothetical protein
VPKLVVVLPSPIDIAIANGKSAPPRILAKIIELDSLGCTYEVGHGAWKLNEELSRLGRLEGTVKEENLHKAVAN